MTAPYLAQFDSTAWRRPLVVQTLTIILIGLASALLLMLAIRDIRVDVPAIGVFALVFGALTAILLKGMKKVAVFPLLCAIVALGWLWPRFIGSGSGGFYTSLQLPVLLERGLFTQDFSFHLAIVESIKHFGYPSTAIHGIPYEPYHFGGHYFLALVSLLSGIPAMELLPYQATYLAALAICFFFLYRSIGSNGGILAPVAIALFFLVDRLESFFWVFDISTPIALLFGFLLLTRIEEKQNVLLESLLLFLTLFAKISAGVYVWAIYLIYCVFRQELTPIRKFYAFAGAAAALVLAMALVSSDATRSASLHLEFDNLRRQLLAHGNREPKVLLFLLFPALVAIVAVIKRDLKLACAAVAVTAISFLAMNVSFVNRANMHFINAGNWMAAFLLAGVKIEWHGKYRRHFPAVALAVLALYCMPDFMKKSSIITDTLSAFPQRTDANAYIDKLGELRKRKGNFLIYIPEQETDFWNHWAYEGDYSSRYFMPFWIPMISGKPAFLGYNPIKMENTKVGGYAPGTYGYAVYYGNANPCAKFDRLLKLTKFGDAIREESLSCQATYDALERHRLGR